MLGRIGITMQPLKAEYNLDDFSFRLTAKVYPVTRESEQVDTRKEKKLS